MKKRIGLKKGKKDGKEDTKKYLSVNNNYYRTEKKKEKVTEKKNKENKQKAKADLITVDEGDSAGFTCVPFHSKNSTSQTGVSNLSKQDAYFHGGAFTPTSQHTLQKTSSCLPPARRSEESTRSLQHRNNPSNVDETPGGLLNKDESNCGPRRVLLFPGPVVEGTCSTGEDTCTSNHCVQDKPDVTSGNCCWEQRLKNEALRNNMACKLCRIKYNVSYYMKFCRHNIS